MKRMICFVLVGFFLNGCGETATDLARNGYRALDQHQFQEAASYYEEALTLEPDDQDARLWLACAYIGLGRHERASAEIAAFKKHRFYDAIILAGFLKHQELADLEGVYSNSLMAAAYLRRGVDYTCDAHFDEAMTNFETARRFDPKDGMIDFQIARLIVETQPEVAVFYLERGFSKRHQGNSYLEDHPQFEQLEGYEPFDQLRVRVLGKQARP
ncbi:tetratricopeptide repeat protein [Acanthopleuribacter pedis]|uniref:Tetratricopeptide repeat protein n=1 Tax=Acanthopleuribacter pedis TaxID=442870 RepID=A0A8J7QCP4_9BACT|nr:tetratricopeptide repeat protein [Acanthopleuribacter pedis]MBO1321699.1 tetratricopeptide repeat protein [Acanthopleuribacter pedis]